MKRLRQFLDDPAKDRGAALILVLFVVTVIGLAGAALLTFSDTSIRTTVALRDQAGSAYNADGAAQVAINSLSTGYGFTSPTLFTNANNTNCFGPNTTNGTLNLPSFYPATSGNGTTPGSASVVCSADPNSGDGASPQITSANRPGQAIMTLGQTSADGININVHGQRTFNVGGAVSSYSIIDASHGTLQSTAAVTAFGKCSGTIVSTATKCDTHTPLNDPNYKSEPEVVNTVAPPVPTYQELPATCPGGVMTFQPGYYDDAVSLSDLMNGGTCSTWWFKPGTYYFDFHNNPADTDVYRGTATGPNTWTINQGNLVAGTPADSSGHAILSPGSSPTIPGSCQDPNSVGALGGVQFIFGGDSQLVLGGSAAAEICGTYNANRPPIAVFGLKSGAATSTTLTGTGTGTGSSLKMSTVASAGKFTTTPTNIIQKDNLSGTWNKTTSTRESSTITVSGYAPPAATPIPAGSIVKTATVRVTHANSAKYQTGAGNDSLAVTFTPKGVTGSRAATAIPLTTTLSTTSAVLVTDSTTIQALGGTSAFATYVHDYGFTGADMAYAATLSHSGKENVDAIQIDITYVIPAFRSEGDISTNASNCIAAGSCAVISNSADFYIQGTTYAPFADINLSLNNGDHQVWSFGLISRSLTVTQWPQFTDTSIEVPDYTTGGNSSPVVFLTVYVCPAKATSTCSTDPVDPLHPERGPIKALRVKAMMGAASSPPSLMTILSWSNLRGATLP